MIPICSICLDKFTPDSVVKTTKCGHIFHRACILPWLSRNPHCPECRQFGPVLYRLYLSFKEITVESMDKDIETQAHDESELYTQIAILNVKVTTAEAKNKKLQDHIEDLEFKIRESISRQRNLFKRLTRLFVK